MMTLDSSGELKNLVEEFVQETNPELRYQILDNIIYKWCFSKDVDPNSYFNGQVDARKFVALENILGNSLPTTTDFAYNYPSMISSIEQTYSSVKETIYSILMAQSHVKNIFNIMFEGYDPNNTSSLNMNGVIAEINNVISNNQETGKELLSEYTRILNGLGFDSLESYQNYYNSF